MSDASDWLEKRILEVESEIDAETKKWEGILDALRALQKSLQNNEPIQQPVSGAPPAWFTIKVGKTYRGPRIFQRPRNS